jgi:type II secretory pathway component GspD/PulD (secretin)
VEEGESTLVGVRFQAEVRTNSIVAIGSASDMVLVEAVLRRLDAESLNNRTVFTMKLINTPATELAQILNSHYTTERQFMIQNQATFLPQSPKEQYLRETSIIAEPASNSLIISTTPQYYEQIRKIILDLDERPTMVAIDVLIAEVELNRTKDSGVEVALQDSFMLNRGLSMPTLPSVDGSQTALGFSAGNVPFTDGRAGTRGITSLVPNPNAGGFAFSISGESASVFIRALEIHNKMQVLSRPRLVTLHNRRASIEVGQSLPFESGGTVTNNGNVNTSTGFEKVGTILDLTPRIMPDGMIALAVYAERSSLISYVDIGNGMAPQLKRSNASTTINAWDGQTVIFAGLITEEKSTENRSIPGLNKIPVVKHFFEYDAKTYKRTELVIILTPRIIRSPGEMWELNQQERERMQWCVSDVVRMTGDYGMQLRSDAWNTGDVPHIQGTPVNLDKSQLPPDSRIPMPLLPTLDTQ